MALATIARKTHSGRFQKGDDLLRFWSQIVIPEDFEACYDWQGKTDKGGYGRVFFQGKTRLAHRVAWFLYHGYWAKQCVLHACDNRVCINILHLRDGSYQDNIRDMVTRNRQSQGENHPSVKLTAPDVIVIRKRLAVKPYVLGLKTAIAREYGVTKRLITAIDRNEIWQCLIANKEGLPKRNNARALRRRYTKG
jgi:hypothetical protein